MLLAVFAVQRLRKRSARTGDPGLIGIDREMGQDGRKMTIEAKIENLDDVLAFIDAELEAADCPMKKQMQIDVAVEEIFVNIANYAYAPETGSADINVRIAEDPKRVIITFTDSGMPYDPVAREDPDIDIPAEDREVGGLGVFMVKQMMDDMDYSYQNGKNILTVQKML